MYSSGSVDFVRLTLRPLYCDLRDIILLPVGGLSYQSRNSLNSQFIFIVKTPQCQTIQVQDSDRFPLKYQRADQLAFRLPVASDVPWVCFDVWHDNRRCLEKGVRAYASRFSRRRVDELARGLPAEWSEEQHRLSVYSFTFHARQVRGREKPGVDIEA